MIFTLEEESAREKTNRFIKDRNRGFWNAADLSPLRYLLTETPPIEWVIPDLLARGVVGFLYGEGGTYKSLAALRLVIRRACANIHMNQRWLDRFPVPSGRSIFFSAEDVDLDFHHRVRGTVASIDNERADIPRESFVREVSENCLLVPREKWKLDGELFLVDADGNRTKKMESIVNLTKEFGADLIILETSSRIAAIEENSNELAARMVGVLEEIRDRTGATVLCIAHSSKLSRQMKTDTHGQNGLRPLSGGWRPTLARLLNSLYRCLPGRANSYTPAGKTST